MSVTETIDRIKAEATANTIYSELGDAIDAGTKLLIDTPDLRIFFQTNASGGFDNFPQTSSSGARLFEVMNQASGGMSLTSANEAMVAIEQIAIETGRRVSRYKQNGAHVTEISPVVEPCL